MKTVEIEGQFLTLMTGRFYHAGGTPHQKCSGSIHEPLWVSIWDILSGREIWSCRFANSFQAAAFTTCFNISELEVGSKTVAGRQW